MLSKIDISTIKGFWKYIWFLEFFKLSRILQTEHFAFKKYFMASPSNHVITFILVDMLIRMVTIIQKCKVDSFNCYFFLPFLVNQMKKLVLAASCVSQSPYNKGFF